MAQNQWEYTDSFFILHSVFFEFWVSLTSGPDLISTKTVTINQLGTNGPST